MAKNTKNYTHTEQLELMDCGVACLLSALKYFNGNSTIQTLREMSGTSLTGTTLLGLLQAAEKVGIKAQGFQADLEHLKTLETPAILHVHKRDEEDADIEHYVLSYGFDEGKQQFIISDPANPFLEYLDEEKVEEIWNNKTLLLLEPTSRIDKVSRYEWVKKLGWIAGLLKEDYNHLFTSLGLGLLLTLLGLALAVFSQQLVDKILPHKDISVLIMGCVLLLLLLLSKSLISYLRQQFLLEQGVNFTKRIINYFYHTLLYLPKAFFDTRKTGEVIARMSDTNRIQGTITTLASETIVQFMTLIISTVAIFSYNSTIGWLSLTWIPIFIVILLIYRKPILEKQRSVMRSYAVVEGNFIDTIQGINPIKISNKQNQFSKQTGEIYGHYQQQTYDLGIKSLNFSVLSEVSGVIFMVGLILLSSFFVFWDIISVGSVVAILQLLTMMMGATAVVAGFAIEFQGANVAFQRMEEFTNYKPEFKPSQEEEKIQIQDFTDLEVNNVKFRYTGQLLLLDDINLQVKKGEIVAILGKSGCGKSTLLQLLQRYYQPETGSILVDGKNIEELSITSWRDLVGVVPQHIKMFSGNVLANIVMGDEDFDADELSNMLQELQLDTYIDELPQSLLTILGEEGINISGGQKQIIGLLRAIYRKPKLLLLDEATGAMDTLTEKKIMQVLQKLRPDMAIIMVTHRINPLAIADRLYVIEDGQITASGDPRELLEEDNFYSRSVLEKTF